MQKIIILDLGSETTQVIGRRVRELDTFCEVLPYNNEGLLFLHGLERNPESSIQTAQEA